MELFLNLCWLLLAIPAIWVWHEARSAQPSGRFHSRRSLLLLACLVVLLFPVISASDDLQAMRPEVEESGVRDSIRGGQGHRLASLIAVHGAPPALLSQPGSIAPAWQSLGKIVIRDSSRIAESFVPTRPGRGPPLSFPV